MNIVLHPRAAPEDRTSVGDRIRVWLGLAGRTTAPTLRWRVDGAPRAPDSVPRALGSVRPDELLDGNPPRVFSGVFEFAGLDPGRRYQIGVTTGDGDAAEITVRTLPAEAPQGLDEWFSILLVSCYYHAEAPRGVLESVLGEIKREIRVDLSLLLGDQVYLDLPTLADFVDDERWLAEKFERDYVRNWFGPGGYHDVLAMAPSVSVPDDHEYWNNFPHASPFIQNTYSAGGRGRWRQAARAVWEGFQLTTAVTEPVVLDVPPVSICIADSRSARDPRRGHALHPDALTQVSRWARRLERQDLFGIFATGQSLFDPAAGELAGRVVDRKLSDYADFGDLVRILTTLTKPLLCVTGDVHWGRIVEVRDVTRERQPVIYEVITSPATLVTTLKKDTLLEVGAAISGLFGARTPWPRHAEPEACTTYFAASEIGGNRLSCDRKHGQKGDQIAVLSLRRHGFGMYARVTYYSVHPDPRVRYSQKTAIREFDLSAGILGT